MTNTIWLWSTFIICCFSAAACVGADQAGETRALVRVIDLSIGESQALDKDARLRLWPADSPLL